MPATITFVRPTYTDVDTLTAAQFNACTAASATVADATTSTLGVIKLAGGLDGTGETPVVRAGHITLARMADMATDNLIGRSTGGTGAPELIPCTAVGRSVIAAADAAAIRTVLGLGTLATQSATITSVGNSIITAADAAAVRTVLGLGTLATQSTTLGTIATQNANSVSITGGSVTGITDLAIADGGTAASTAVLARANLNKGETALSDGTNIATDCSLGNVFSVTLGGNRTLSNPTNHVAGATYLWIIRQDGGGNRTLAYGTAFKFPGGVVPTLSTAAGAVDILSGVSDGTNLYVAMSRAFA